MSESTAARAWMRAIENTSEREPWTLVEIGAALVVSAQLGWATMLPAEEAT